MMVETDMNQCLQKRKIPVDWLPQQQWVFGATCRETQECFLFTVGEGWQQLYYQLLGFSIVSFYVFN